MRNDLGFNPNCFPQNCNKCTNPHCKGKDYAKHYIKIWEKFYKNQKNHFKCKWCSNDAEIKIIRIKDGFDSFELNLCSECFKYAYGDMVKWIDHTL